MQTFFDLKGKHVHFVGINGVGVNALAKYCLEEGAIVSGSDRHIGDYCLPLIQAGCDLKEGTNLAALESADALVYTSAIREDNPELLRAKEKGIKLFERHEFLSGIAKGFDKVVGIAGSHGKTTVTAMLTHVLKTAGKNFVSMIGGDAIKYSNFVNNQADGERIFVTEACEYRRHMLSLDLDVAVLLNTDWDHPDSYPTRESVELAFAEFLNKAQTQIDGKDNFVHVRGDDETTFEYYGRRVFLNGEFVGVLGENLKGEYNKRNALFAIATACALGVKQATAIKAVNTFLGVKRRFEYVGKIDGVPVVFDFAHHPTEIKNLLERASEYGKMLVVFQPHTYSRTKAYMNEFAEVFASSKDISSLILLPTYAAREAFDKDFDSDALMRKILSKNAELKVYLAKDNASSAEFAKYMAKDVGIVLFVGAGDIYDLRRYFQVQE